MASILNSVMGSNNDNDTEMKAMDANRYATKKTIAQGMLDIALLTANASQLKYILQIGREHPFYTLMLTLICASITLQIMTGILLAVQGFLSYTIKKHQNVAEILNHVILLFIFLSSFIDVIKIGFGFEPAVPEKKEL